MLIGFTQGSSSYLRDGFMYMHSSNDEKIKSLDQIERTNAEGQVVNIARELGTNKENRNVNLGWNNIKINGVLLDAQPPFAQQTIDSLIDATRTTEAIIGMGLEYWVFNVVYNLRRVLLGKMCGMRLVLVPTTTHLVSLPLVEILAKHFARWVAIKMKVLDNLN